MNKINTHSIINLIGVSSVNKTEVANNIKNGLQQKYPNISIEIISEKTDIDVINKIKEYSSIENKKEILIINSNNNKEDFRNDVVNIAEKINYNLVGVVFNYKTSELVLSNYQEVEFFKKEVLQKLNKKKYDLFVDIVEKTQSIDFDIIDYEKYIKSNNGLDGFDKDVVVIGDIHENVEPLKLLINDLRDTSKIVFVGDLIDKGNNTKETINYIYDLWKLGRCIIVKGNHESFVAKRLKKEIQPIEEEKENENFSSIKVFENDESLKNKFLELYDEMLPFLKINRKNNIFYVNHAPCKNKYIGKIDSLSEKNQRNIYFGTRENDAINEKLKFVFEEKNHASIYHVFGHVAHDMENIVTGNKIWLDTGSVYGNKLSAIVINSEGDFVIVDKKSNMLYESELIHLESDFEHINVLPENEKKNFRLSREDEYWVNKVIKNGVEFLAGTIPPSASDGVSLEPIGTALSYYKNNGIFKLIVEPKYMGSRIQFYMNNKDYKIVLKNGGLLKQNDKTSLLYNYWFKYTKDIFKWNKNIILDCELTPWGFLADSLIENEFEKYIESASNENDVLLNDSVYKSFKNNLNNQSSLELERSGISIFKEQLSLYNKKDEDIKIYPFSVLKVDDNLVDFDNYEMFSKLLPLELCLVIDMENDPNYEKNIMLFFEKITKELRLEGVVIKPLKEIENILPAIKVRNEDYLHIIYGHNYKNNYMNLVKHKNIKKKSKLAISEYNLGRLMLQAKNKEELMEYLIKFKLEINQELSVDNGL